VSTPTTTTDRTVSRAGLPDSAAGVVPVAPALSMFDPVFLGLDEFGHPVYTTLIYRNFLTGGEPGGGKSGVLNTITAHASLCSDARLVLFDGKLVELGNWEDCADVFVGPDLAHAIRTLKRLQAVMDNRYAFLRSRKRRKIARSDGLNVIVAVFDEIAYFSATAGSKAEQEEFSSLLRDLVARGRACGIVVIAATQRPSVDIIPTSLRDIFGFRMAFRCTTEASSDIILGRGWAAQGYTAQSIPPDDNSRGVAYLIAEGGVPVKMRAAYLDDSQIDYIATYAAQIRSHLHVPDLRPTTTSNAAAVTAAA
jgi:S-DNA-T family DNA segregation ATPase FtsK/SpoIIIE